MSTCLGRVKGSISQTGAAGVMVQLAVLGSICQSGYVVPPNISYVYFDDGETYIRKGVRDAQFVLDIRLTSSPGWNGIINIDWKNLRTIKPE